MDGVIAVMPNLCPVLKAEAARRRTAATEEAARILTGNDGPKPAPDLCASARADWATQNRTEADLRAYIAALPAACSDYRGQAEVRIKLLESERLAAEKEANAKTTAAVKKAEDRRLAEQAETAREQAAALHAATIAAQVKATSLLGRWVSSKDKLKACENSIEYRMEDGELVEHWHISNKDYRWTVRNVTANSVRWDDANEKIVSGDQMWDRKTPQFVFFRCK